MVIPYPSGLFLNEKPSAVIKPFKRTLISNLWSDPENEYTIEVNNNSKDLLSSLSFMSDIDDVLNDLNTTEVSSHPIVV